MPQLQRLIYRSEATGRTDSLLNVATILGEAQRNNARIGLTGALAAHDGRFLQVVEGESGILDALLRRLAVDPRHRDLVILDRVDIAARRFSDWSMANATISPDKAPLLDQLTKDPHPSGDALAELLAASVQTASPAQD